MLDIKKVVAIGSVISLGLVLSACQFLQTGGDQGQKTTTSQQQASQTETGGEVAIITGSDVEFNPNQVAVKSGGKIKWVNSSSSKIQVASDPHPIHTANQELTNGQFVLEVAPGASAEVTVSKTGAWGYHDHLNPGNRGKVVVQ